MKTLTVQIPDTVDEREAKMLLAAKLYEKGSLSLGQAAELVGYSKRTFMELWEPMKYLFSIILRRN